MIYIISRLYLRLRVEGTRMAMAAMAAMAANVEHFPYPQAL